MFDTIKEFFSFSEDDKSKETEGEVIYEGNSLADGFKALFSDDSKVNNIGSSKEKINKYMSDVCKNTNSVDNNYLKMPELFSE